MSSFPGLPDFDRSFLPVIDDALDRHADRIWAIFGDEQITFAELDSRSALVANALVRDGFQSGDRGAVYSTNSPIAFVTALGIIRAGGIWVPMNPFNAVETNLGLLDRFGCRVVFPGARFIGTITDGDAPDGCTVRPLDDSLDDWTEGMSTTAPAIERAGSDTMLLPQTGGTTGDPKGVMLSHRNFVALSWATAAAGGADNKTLVAAPMTHVGGRAALAALESGTTQVILESVDIAAIIQSVEQHRITNFLLPPTAIYSLLDHPDLATADLSSLRSIAYGSAPMSLERLREAFDKLGPIMMSGYGQTECPMSIARRAPADHFVDGDVTGELLPDEQLRAVGRPTRISTVAIVDVDGTEQPVGTAGEIAVKGPMVCEGYWEDPEETAKIRLNGWHLTGDIGVYDEDGLLYIVDRKKDMIITGGFNVYSSEVEHALREIPGIADAAVIGVADDQWGEAIRAFVTVTAGSAPIEEEIIAATKEALGSVKTPKSVVFIDEMPHTTVGKIDKKALRNSEGDGGQ
ncbi:MAG: class I adenylate-forming enzyme family protein [Acidimicrobiales bacterium]